ncbi:MAG: autotransporter outer membrane beta-barrel domain-containing protein [Desulfobaccales bacterium]
MLAPDLSWSDDLSVDASLGNSPYTVGSDLSYANEYIGTTAAGGVFNQNDHTNTVTDRLYLGRNSGNSGSYTLSGGSLSAQTEYIGSSGSGAFTQSGGTNTISGVDLYLGYLSGSSGSYTLSGGSLSAAREHIGYYGTGAFTQSGGTNTISDYLEVGGFSSGSGTYILNAGSLSTSDEYIGGNMSSGSGTFTQNGGTNTASNYFIIAWDSSSNSSYDLRDGSLSVGSTECIGYGGIGTFTQSGGTHTLAQDLYLGVLYFSSSASSGTYNLSGGSLSVTGAEYIGYSGTGTFTQSGGTHTISQGLYLGVNSGSSGTYTLSGGSLSVTGGEYIGYGSTGDFIQTGGSHTVSGGIWLGSGSSGTYTLSGGSLTADQINGNLVNGGTFTPLTSGTTVTGNYTQTASGTLEVQVASASSYSKLAVTGSASLNGALKIVLQGGFIPSYGQRFPGILTATGGVSGTFSSVVNQYITPTLYWNVLYSANSVDLGTSTFEAVVVRNYTNPALGLTGNQWQVGNMLNGVAATATGDLNNVLNNIDQLTSYRQVANTYQQISVDKATSLPTLGFAGARLQWQGLSNRIDSLRFAGMEGGSGLGGRGGFNMSYSKLNGLMLAYNSSSLADLITAKRPAAPENRWGLYLEPGGILGSMKSTMNQTGYNFNVAGFNAGADYRVSDHLLMGLGTGYSHTSTDFHNYGGGAQTNTWPLMAYAAYLPQSFYAYGSAGYALNLFNLERNLSFGEINRTARSSPAGHQFNAYGEAGYDLKAGRLVVTPVASLAYSSLWVDGFTETGAGSLNLKVDPQHAESLQTGVGAKLAVPLRVASAKVVPQLCATYQHEYLDGTRGIDARLSQGSSTFSFQTEHPGRDFAVVGANVTVYAKKNIGVQVNYNTEVGRARYTAHLLNAGLRCEF